MVVVVESGVEAGQVRWMNMGAGNRTSSSEQTRKGTFQLAFDSDGQASNSPGNDEE